MKQIVLIATLFLAVQLGCPGATQKTQGNVEESGFSGKVLETTNAATYTYVLVDTGSQKLWAAAPQFNVKPGDKVSVTDAMAMKKYHSKTLNRTFDVVYFTGGVTVNGAKPTSGAATPMGELPKGHPPIGGGSAGSATGGLPKDHPQIGGGSAGGAMGALPKDHPPIGGGEQVKVSGIKKADGGKTVAEVYAGKGQLKGKQTRVRGKVVKYNPNIMGKNWVHIQDGTGAKGSNDLLVTTSSEVKVGDTVLVSGAVAVDRDFGAGYKYPVLIEDAKITVE